MSSKSWYVVLAVLGFVAFGVSSASAAGRGGDGPRVGGTFVGSRPGWGNPGQFPRTGNGVFGPSSAYGNPYWGYGCGYPGWGYAPWIAGYGYELVGVPYFAEFPPVYYGYEDSVPVVKASVRSSWAASEGPLPAAGAAPIASPPRPPLRIINPYYVEGKADKP